MSYRFKEIISVIDNMVKELSSITFYEEEQREDKLLDLKERIELIFLKYPFNPVYWVVRLSGINYEYKGSGLSQFDDPSGKYMEQWRERTINLLRNAKVLIKERLTDIFIVHGHDNQMKEHVENYIKDDLGLNPIILFQQVNMGRTIIEKFEKYSNVGVAIILVSPDDIGYSKARGPEEAKPRARQNVILELGYFIAKLGRESVIVLHQPDNEELGDLELPSDIHGVLYIHFDKDGFWKEKVIQELRENGFDIDL